MVSLGVLSQSAGYTVTFILSLCVLIPMSIHLTNFKGHCALFTTGTFIEDDGRFDPNWASCFYCGLTIFVGVLTLITSSVQLIRMIRLMNHGEDSSFLSAFIDTLVALILSLLVLTDAIIVTVGFSSWCTSVTQRFDSCETASSVMIIGKDSGINSSGFFIQLGSVQFGIWTALVCWVLLLVLAARKLFVYHERENMIISMARERQRISTTQRPQYANLETT